MCRLKTQSHPCELVFSMKVGSLTGLNVLQFASSLQFSLRKYTLDGVHLQKIPLKEQCKNSGFFPGSFKFYDILKLLTLCLYLSTSTASHSLSIQQSDQKCDFTICEEDSNRNHKYLSNVSNCRRKN